MQKPGGLAPGLAAAVVILHEGQANPTPKRLKDRSFNKSERNSNQNNRSLSLLVRPPPSDQRGAAAFYYVGTCERVRRSTCGLPLSVKSRFAAGSGYTCSR